MVIGIFFLFGIIIGSFFANLIFRLQRNESIIRNISSHCDSCDSKIHWYDNIPVISYLLLRGKCRKCGKNISCIYIFFELCSGIIFGLTYLAFAQQGILFAIVFALIFEILFFLSTYDAIYWIVEDMISIPFIIILIILNILSTNIEFFQNIFGKYFGYENIWAGIILAILFAILVIATQGKIGGGEIRVGAFIGLITGLKGSYVAIMSGLLLAILFFLFDQIIRKLANKSLLGKENQNSSWNKNIIPLVPFLSLGIIIAVFSGSYIFNLLFNI
jgi:prepilin signal peptidase PulO-like enzyme (type II secretory pathway)